LILGMLNGPSSPARDFLEERCVTFEKAREAVRLVLVS